MDRLGFLHSLISIFGASVLPKELIAEYKKIYLLECFVRGFKYYAGPSLINEMKEGVELELVRERNNPHDHHAIALHYKNEKIGFIPAEHNSVLSRMLDAEVVEMLAEITHIEKNAASWENVHAAIYILKPMNHEVPEHGLYTKEVTRPLYFTLGQHNGHISRFRIPEYGTNTALMSFSFNNTNSGISIPEKNEIQKTSPPEITVINRKRLPGKYQKDSLTQAIPGHEIKLDSYLDEDGYIVASVDRLAELDNKIVELVDRATKSGQQIKEALLRD